MKLNELLEKYNHQKDDDLIFIHDANSIEILAVLHKDLKNRFENCEVIGFGLSQHYKGIAVYINNEE